MSGGAFGGDPGGANVMLGEVMMDEEVRVVGEEEATVMEESVWARDGLPPTVVEVVVVFASDDFGPLEVDTRDEKAGGGEEPV